MTRAIFATSIYLTLAVAAAYAAQTALPPATVPMLFLIAVIAAATQFGLRAGMAAAVSAFLICNFLFVEPRFTFRVADADDALSLFVLLAAGAATGFMAGRAREQADRARARAEMLTGLADFADDLARARDDREIVELARERLAAAGGAPIVLLERAEGLRVDGGANLGADDLAAAERAWRRGTAGRGAARGWAGGCHDFAPVPGGVIGVRSDAPGASMLAPVAAQAMAAAGRAAFAREAEREKLRAALLSSLSHDLRTPLATIRGAASSLRELDAALAPGARADLAVAIDEEAARLARHVDNLLQMTRLRAGLDLRLDWIDANDIAHGAVARARRAHPGRAIALVPDPRAPLVRGDATLLEQALFNAVDNAVKFSHDEVRVLVRAHGGGVEFRVDDRGCGISPADLPDVFEPFFRSPDAREPGTGLGLAIVAGIVRALGGTASAISPGADGASTSVTLSLPEARIGAA